ncbi:aspartate/glutamate racemase family protein [Marinicella meishanensis]|uniref:aspartate/glutamate racemase family protein n=1 Tax=Marinicella meishanensis TaxID=2873263 RepID=UPI001CC05773|nr:amino acid racemase [Marinicella sp. NBU2979]
MSNTQHIGIVGCSAEGAALCYKTICTQAPKVLGEHAHPEVSMHTHSLARYVACLDAGDWAGVGELMLSSARKLALQGADFLICPDNTIHQAFGLIAEHLPLPWLHIAEVVASQAQQRGHQHPGILGTEWLVNSQVYPEQLEAKGLSWSRPAADQIQTMSDIIMQELVYGIINPQAVESLQHTIVDLAEQGCDSVILGCTELPLVLHAGNSPLPTLNSTRLLAEAAIQRAVGPQ